MVYSLPATDDDTLTIKCQDPQDDVGRSFNMKRSSLLRSPSLNEFFRSEDYLHGCKMTLTFEDPAACFHILKTYLDEGPDCYTKTRLRIYITLHYKMMDRFVILGKLYLLAKRLALGGLMNIAYENIVEGEQSITPPICFAMAGLVYDPKAEFDKPLKDWCLKHVGGHFFALYDMDDWWTELEHQLEPELGHHWAKLIAANGCLVSALEGKGNQTWLVGIIHELAQEGHENIMSVIEECSYAKDVQRILGEVLAEEKDASDDGWEDVEQAPDQDQPQSPQKSAAAINNIGMDMMKQSVSANTLSMFVNTESAKARSIMGMDQVPTQVMSSTKLRLRSNNGRLNKLLRHY